ncbi:MAG: hypothetical protein AAGI67_14220 [Pseudomonadota bacterium]
MAHLPIIEGFTIGVPDLGAAISCYETFLEYERRWEGPAGSLAELWSAPALADAPCAELLPRGAQSGFVRFVQVEATPGYVPFRYPGWNAAEIAVADVDALAESLGESPFRILGPPAELSISKDIRAMQVEGPGGELLYLTQIKAPIPGFDLPILERGVGHCFVGIVAGQEGNALKQWYRQQFQLEPDPPLVDARVQGLSLAFDLDRETRHPICALPLAPGYLVEIDQMPAADDRPTVAGVPAGIISMSFSVSELPPGLAAVRLPGSDASAAKVVGASGEWLELVTQ